MMEPVEYVMVSDYGFEIRVMNYVLHPSELEALLNNERIQIGDTWFSLLGIAED